MILWGFLSTDVKQLALSVQELDKWSLIMESDYLHHVPESVSAEHNIIWEDNSAWESHSASEDNFPLDQRRQTFSIYHQNVI